MSAKVVKTVIYTEVGALPYGESGRNRLVIESGMKRSPKDLDDQYQAKVIKSWFKRYVPAPLFDALFGGEK